MSPIPWLGPLGPWIPGSLGVVAMSAFPSIRFKRRSAPGTDRRNENDLFGPTALNPIFIYVEDGIREHIQRRIKSRFDRASHDYDWPTIKLAGERAIEEELVMEHLTAAVGAAAMKAVERFSTRKKSSDADKYFALLRLLKCCSFRLLRDDLIAAKRDRP
jgi:hypothetical protein